MEMSDRLRVPAALLSGKEPPYPLDRKLRGTQNRIQNTKCTVCMYVCMYVCIYVFMCVCVFTSVHSLQEFK